MVPKIESGRFTNSVRPDQMPLFSIITPSYNRESELKFLIDSIIAQTIDHQSFEMIISDDGSSDGTMELLKSYQKKVDFPLHVLTQKNQGPGAARNHGLEHAKGEMNLFIDSDCEAHPDWLKTIKTAYEEENFDCCGGPDGALDNFSILQKAIDLSMTSFFTTGGMRGHSEKMITKFYPRSHNMGMSRELYNKVGGFGSLRHGQDIELSHRIISSGAKVKFVPDAIVYHRRRTSLKRFFRQVFNWGVARINLYKIDKALLKPVHVLPAAAVVGFILLLTGSIVWPFVFKPLLITAIAGLIMLGLFGAIKWKSLRVGLLCLIVIPIQLGGYGLGFISAYIHRVIFNRDEFTGFKKRYYQ